MQRGGREGDPSGFSRGRGGFGGRTPMSRRTNEDVDRRQGGFGRFGRPDANFYMLPSPKPIVPQPPPLSDAAESDADLVTSCPVCMESYSDIRFPIVLVRCGHSICIECDNSLGYRNCVTCGCGSQASQGLDNDDPYTKNYALLDLLNLRAQEKEKFLNEKKKMEDELVDKEKLLVEKLEKQQLLETVTKELEVYKTKELTTQDHISCSKCETKEKMERMKICETCTKQEESIDWMHISEEKVLPLCAFCCYCRGEHPQHVFRDYSPWKLNKLTTSAVLDGKAAVMSMDEVCFHEIERGKKKMNEWIEKMDSLQDFDSDSYEDAQRMAALLREESELVCNASEGTLPQLRKFTKTLRDSSARLDCLKKDGLTKKNEDGN